MDNLLTLLGVRRRGFVIGVPGADDIMLGYQSMSFHDALYVRRCSGCARRRSSRTGCAGSGMLDDAGRVLPVDAAASPLRALTVAP